MENLHPPFIISIPDVVVAIAGVPGAPAPLASMVTLLTPARTVQLTLGRLVEVVVEMILAGNYGGDDHVYFFH